MKKKKKIEEPNEYDMEEDNIAEPQQKHQKLIITQPVSSQGSQTSPPPSPGPGGFMKHVSTNQTAQVQPYYDEELNQYLFEPASKQEPINVKEIRQPTHSSIYSSTYESTRESSNQSKDAYYKNLVNIGLFIFIGILIIFLCDQITEIAVNLGMKRTVALLEPYLTREKNTI